MKTTKELLIVLLDYMQNDVTTEWGICSCISALDITQEESDLLDEYVNDQLRMSIKPRYGISRMYYFPLGEFTERIEFVKELIENEEDQRNFTANYQ